MDEELTGTILTEIGEFWDEATHARVEGVSIRENRGDGGFRLWMRWSVGGSIAALESEPFPSAEAARAGVCNWVLGLVQEQADGCAERARRLRAEAGRHECEAQRLRRLAEAMFR